MQKMGVGMFLRHPCRQSATGFLHSVSEWEECTIPASVLAYAGPARPRARACVGGRGARRDLCQGHYLFPAPGVRSRCWCVVFCQCVRAASLLREDLQQNGKIDGLRNWHGHGMTAAHGGFGAMVVRVCSRSGCVHTRVTGPMAEGGVTRSCSHPPPALPPSDGRRSPGDAKDDGKVRTRAHLTGRDLGQPKTPIWILVSSLHSSSPAPTKSTPADRTGIHVQQQRSVAHHLASQ